MNRINGKVIAVVLACLFVLVSAAFAVGLVVHGVRSSSEAPLTVSEELQQRKEEYSSKKAEKTTRTTLKTTTTQKTTAAKKKTTTAAGTSTTTGKATTTKKTTAKNTTSATKKTTVKKTTKKTAAKPAASGQPSGEKVIYLTFDDGPGPYTDKLLSILDEYEVKATFFVTNLYPDYRACIAKEARAGHVVAVHSYTHDYAKIYSSTSAYWTDFNRMNDIVKKQTGSPTSMFRFPGGSSNTVSCHYREGIMTTLTRQADKKGLTYYDWNVTSGDAGETTSSKQVYKNIVHQVKGQKKSIVLCHDVKSYTVKAMERTIVWCLDHGYTFRVLEPGGFTVHHNVVN